MGKPLVHVVLADIGRLDEYTLFFRELQVNEYGRTLPTPESEPAAAV